MRESQFAKLGLELVVDEIFTPPLSDATSLVQKVRSARPELLFLLPTAVSDDKLVIEKLNEFGLGRGRIPVISNGIAIAAPDMLSAFGGPDGRRHDRRRQLAHEGQRGADGRIQEEDGEPWMTQETVCTYGDMWILKEALEKAGSADRKKVANALRTGFRGPAKFFPGGRIKFDDKGRRVGAGLLIVQWQNGEPVTVFPPDVAVAKPFWPKQ